MYTGLSLSIVGFKVGHGSSAITWLVTRFGQLCIQSKSLCQLYCRAFEQFRWSCQFSQLSLNEINTLWSVNLTQPPPFISVIGEGKGWPLGQKLLGQRNDWEVLQHFKLRLDLPSEFLWGKCHFENTQLRGCLAPLVMWNVGMKKNAREFVLLMSSGDKWPSHKRMQFWENAGKIVQLRTKTRHLRSGETREAKEIKKGSLERTSWCRC